MSPCVQVLLPLFCIVTDTRYESPASMKAATDCSTTTAECGTDAVVPQGVPKPISLPVFKSH